jgi:hypothetical protein
MGCGVGDPPNANKVKKKKSILLTDVNVQLYLQFLIACRFN